MVESQIGLATSGDIKRLELAMKSDLQNLELRIDAKLAALENKLLFSFGAMQVIVVSILVSIKFFA